MGSLDLLNSYGKYHLPEIFYKYIEEFRYSGGIYQTIKVITNDNIQEKQ